MEALSIADLIIVGVILISALISFARGFLREILSLIAWIAALVVGFNFAEELAPVLQPYISDETLRYWVAVGLLFAVALVLLGMVNFVIGRMLLQMGISGTDRFAGLLFGALRGGLIVALLILGLRVSPFDAAEMWPDAQLVVYFNGVADWLWSLISGWVENLDLPGLESAPEKNSGIEPTVTATDSGIAPLQMDAAAGADANPEVSPAAESASDPVSDLGTEQPAGQ